MRTFPLARCGLLLILAASVALASEREKLAVRPVMLSESSGDETHRIYVKGQVVTTLRFEKPVEPSKRWRMEQKCRFSCGPPGRERWAGADQQVDVFKSHESSAAMRAALREALKENGALTEENERYRQEETSADHALAALLASGAVAQTPFRIADRFSGKDADAEIDAQVFQGKGKVAVVFKVKNLHAENAWSVQRVRLVTKESGREREVAVRATVREVTPGGSGVVAIVADGRAFIDEGTLTSLWLEVYRHDGLRQAFVQLDPALVAR
jgi:hypothetical protein